MKIIKDKKERQTLTQIEEELFSLNKKFPDKKFSDRFIRFSYTTFEDIFYESFYNALKYISGNNEICIHFIAPTFLEYTLPYVEVNPKEDTEDDYVDIFQIESNDESSWPLDTMLITIMDKCIIYPKTQSASWVAYGERKTDITVLAFTNEKDENIFKTTHDNVLSYDEILGIIGMNFPKGISGIPNKFLTKFKKNYS